MVYYDTPEHPLREALSALTGVQPPAFVDTLYDTRSLTDQQQLELQEWAASNARPYWTTGLAVIEAAELLVAGAVENANIDRPD